MSKSKNPQISQKVVQRPDVIGTEFSVDYEKEEKKEKAEKSSAQERKIQAIAKKSRQLETVAEKIAEDKFCQRNHIWPGARQAFPFNSKMHYVDKFYPYAEGGPLFVDEPTRLSDLKQYELKAEAMKKLGHRYLVIKPGMTEIDAREVLA